jgi:hypothetical protein
MKVLKYSWIVINTLLLAFSGNYYFSFEDWYPIDRVKQSGSDITISKDITEINFDPFWSYDLTEFITYTTVPILIIILMNYFRRKRYR